MEGCAKSATFEDMKLELVQTLFRHGARTNEEPELKIYDYFGPSVYQPYGMGQLTNHGKSEAFKIGQMLRHRYADFLDKNYNSKDVFALSSEDDRTRMSLQLVLAGLYPPSPNFVWNQDLKWIPIPIRYTPKEIDPLLKPQYNVRYFGVWEKILNSEKFHNKMSEYSKFFDFIKNKTGVDIKDDPIEKCYMFNSLYVPSKMNLPMPDWFTEEVKNTWREIYAYIVSSMAATPELRRMNGGPLMRTFLENMNIDGVDVNPRKIYLYSGHDHNLFAMKMLLKLDVPDFFDTGSGLILEKWKNSQNRLYVRLLAWTEPGEEPQVLTLGDHDEFCPVEDFVNIVNYAIPMDDEMDQMFNDLTAQGMKNIFLRDSVVHKY